MSDGSQAQTMISSAIEVPSQPFEPPAEIGIASGLQFRVDERYEVEGNAEVVVKSHASATAVLRGSILDISATGCYIQSMARVPMNPGTEVGIIFSIYGTTFRVEALSRFAKTKVGIGFRFLEMDAATRVRLHGVLGDIRSKLIGEDPNAQVPVVERTVL